MQSLRLTWQPGPEAVSQELAVYRSGWSEQLPHRIKEAMGFQTFLLAIWGFWRAGGLMLIGMAMFEWKLLSGKRTSRFYGLASAIPWALGLAIVLYGVFRNEQAQWSIEYSFFIGSQYNYVGSLFMSLGYIFAVLYAYQKGWFGFFSRHLQNVGQMALSGYLIQSIIATLIFYGHGLGYFGSVGRAAQVVVVVAIWGIQIPLASLWLGRFRFGPAEWLWRTISYRKIQPLFR